MINTLTALDLPLLLAACAIQDSHIAEGAKTSLVYVSRPSLTNGGYCHATFTLQNGDVTRLLFSAEKNATLAPSAYCAPILQTCMQQLSELVGPTRPGS